MFVCLRKYMNKLSFYRTRELFLVKLYLLPQFNNSRSKIAQVTKCSVEANLFQNLRGGVFRFFYSFTVVRLCKTGVSVDPRRIETVLCVESIVAMRPW